MNGLRQAAAYAMKPNELGRCGPGGVHETLFRFVKNPAEFKEEEIRSILEKFEVAMPYYCLIARANDLDPFDSKVVEAYWLGNELLDRVDEEDVRAAIVDDAEKNGWDRERIALLFNAIRLKKAKPLHALSVLYFFLFGQTELSSAIKERIDSCRVNAGRVVEAGKALRVRYRPLSFGPGRGVSFSEEAEKKIARGFLEETKPGDLVSFHLDSGIEIIAEKQGENLDHYTREVLAALS